MHFETSAGFHKKLLKRKQSNLKSILVFERQKKEKKAITAVREKWQWSMGNKHFLLCFWAAACTLWISAGGRVPSPSRTERIGSGSRQLDRPRATKPWSLNRSVGETENRKKWWRMSDEEKVVHLRWRIPLTEQPEVPPSFYNKPGHTPYLPGMCENPRLMCVPPCPLSASWRFSWRHWTHDWSCGAFVVAKRRPKKTHLRHSSTRSYS